MSFERKALPFSLKTDSDSGEFTAVFATFDVVDHDGDVTRPGAFEDGAEVIIGSWGHKLHELPVGKGVIRQTDREALVEGRFFLDTQPGRDTYQTVKNLGPLGQWSYVFRVEKSSYGEYDGKNVRFLEAISVYSVDPVLAGAGIDTRTTAIKGLSRDLSFMAHTEGISEAVDEFVSRVKDRLAGCEQASHALSSANMERLAAVAESLRTAGGELEQLLTSSQKSNDWLVREFIRYQRIRAGLAGRA